jgi:hypothetical protein
MDESTRKFKSTVLSDEGSLESTVEIETHKIYIADLELTRLVVVEVLER